MQVDSCAGREDPQIALQQRGRIVISDHPAGQRRDGHGLDSVN
jgi:hypothetical protein